MSRAFRNSEYLDWVRIKECLISKKSADVAHHVRLGDNTSGVGIKPSDYRVIPLTNYFHTISECSVHRIGEHSFYDRYGINPAEVFLKQLSQFLLETYKEAVTFLPGVGLDERVISLEDAIEKHRTTIDPQITGRRSLNLRINEVKRVQRSKLQNSRKEQHEVDLAHARAYQKEFRQKNKPPKDSEYQQELREKAAKWRRESYLKQKEYAKSLS